MEEYSREIQEAVGITAPAQYPVAQYPVAQYPVAQYPWRQWEVAVPAAPVSGYGNSCEAKHAAGWCRMTRRI
ncbi:MAG: hypothetical protein M1350_04735 [Actinobacteria bacterium]|nr:hypothetical protein [Actinomycetota bacterium]